MAWNSIGTVTVTNGSKTLVGVGTNWIKQASGWQVWIRGEERPHEIEEVVSSTELKLVKPIERQAASGLDFLIVPTQGLNVIVRDKLDQVFAQLAAAQEGWEAVVSNFSATAYQLWLDQGNSGTVGDFLSFLVGPRGPAGKSAYDIWIDEGNVGAEADFLDALSDGVLAATTASAIAAQTAQAAAETAEVEAEAARDDAIAARDMTETNRDVTTAARDAAQSAQSVAAAAQAATETARDATLAARDVTTAARDDAQAAQAASQAALAAAATSETNAAASETAAANSETNAGASETAAVTSEANAASSATAAATSETNAAASETAAATSEANAASSATAAATSETNAAASETAAATSAANATSSAAAASTSEANAAASATAASTAETNAEIAQTIAEAAQTAATASEVNAATSKADAATSASAASASATNAATSEASAVSSATAAATSETNAAASEAAAATSDTNAAASATAAGTAETNAAASATAAQGYLDAFEQSYIGQYADDTAANASGKTIVDGVFYYKNTGTKGLRIYDAGVWSDGVLSVDNASGALLGSNNLSDLGDVATARTNLGLGTAAVVNLPTSGDAAFGEVVKGDDTRLTNARMPSSHTHTKSDINDFSDDDYATAAQGILAGSAVQPADIGTAAALDVASAGDAAVGEVVKGDDTRLSDARTPVEHTHDKASILDFSDADYATAAQGALADTALQPASLTGYALETYVDSAISALVDAAPGTLNTLNELAAALGDDPSFATTLFGQIALKLDTSSYTATDVLTKITTVDGANSMLDADMLDGLHAASFATAAQGALANSALQQNDIGSTVQGYSAALAGTTASFTTTEKTKLSGITAGADVTDAVNVTAAGALMDSEVANLEAVKTFDPADYATATQGSLADTAVQQNHTGDLSIAGDLTVLGVIETTAATSATSYALNPSTNGTRATLTLTGATTLTDSLDDGEHISLRVIGGDLHALTYVAGTLWIGGAAPTLTGDDRLNFEKWGADLIGYAGLGIA